MNSHPTDGSAQGHLQPTFESAVPANSLLARMWQGKASRAFYLGWLVLMWLICGGCWAVAWSLYPKGRYRIWDCDISFLGHPQLNPHGWGWWSVGIGLAGVMMGPLVNYVSRGMEELTAEVPLASAARRWVRWGTRCLWLSCAGMLGLAQTPQGDLLDPVHQAFGAMAMGGLYAALLVCWPLALQVVRTGLCAAQGCSIPPASQISTTRRVLLWLASGWGVLGFLLTQGYRFFACGELGRVLKDKHESLWLRFSFWEWILMLAGTVGFAVWVVVLDRINRINRIG